MPYHPYGLGGMYRPPIILCCDVKDFPLPYDSDTTIRTGHRRLSIFNLPAKNLPALAALDGVRWGPAATTTRATTVPRLPLRLHGCSAALI
jgi:hypothetical protein